MESTELLIKQIGVLADKLRWYSERFGVSVQTSTDSLLAELALLEYRDVAGRVDCKKCRYGSIVRDTPDWTCSNDNTDFYGLKVSPGGIRINGRHTQHCQSYEAKT